MHVATTETGSRSITSRLAALWPACVSMLVASVVFAGAVGMYPPLVLHSDPLSYTVAAYRLTETGTYSFGGEDPDVPRQADAAIMPGYPGFLAGFYLLHGDGGDFEGVVRDVHPYVLGVQFVVVVATVGLISLCGIALGGPLVGIVSGLLAAGYLPFAWASSVALTEALGVFLMMVQLLIALRLVDEERTPTPWLAFSFGFVTALLTMVRPIQVLWLLVPVAWAIARRQVRLAVLARLAAIGVVGFLIVFSPWWVRNAVTLQEFHLLTGPNANGIGLGGARLDAQGGWELSDEEWVVYNRAKAAGEDAAAAVADMRIEREWEAGPSEFVAKRVRYTRDVVYWPFLFWDSVIALDANSSDNLRRIRFSAPLDEPTEALVAVQPGQVEYHRILIVLAMIGAGFIRRWPRLLLVATIPFYSILVHSAILFHSRYFFAAMPAIVLLAAAAICGVAFRLRETFTPMDPTSGEEG